MYIWLAVVPILVYGSMEIDGLCVKASNRIEEFNAQDSDNQYQYLVDNYCSNLQTYSITVEAYENSAKYDAQALAMYKELFQKYKSTGVPTADCLGIARTMFCAYTFRYCNPSDGDSNYPVCGFLCSTWTNRCPEQNDLFTLMCGDSRETEKCSDENMLEFFPLILMLFVQ